MQSSRIPTRGGTYYGPSRVPGCRASAGTSVSARPRFGREGQGVAVPPMVPQYSAPRQLLPSPVRNPPIATLRIALARYLRRRRDEPDSGSLRIYLVGRYARRDEL